MDVVGLVPAAGQGTRLGPLPCSKEIFPVGFWSPDSGPSLRPKAAAHHLLEKMRRAGARKALVVLRAGKWDIPACLGDGHFLGMNLAYVVMRRPHGVPFTLDDAYPFMKDSVVLLGFPDILSRPDDAFVRLLQKRKGTGAELVVGVYRALRPEKEDLLELDSRGGIRRIEFKTQETSLRHTWLMAVWGPAFTEFMHRFVEAATPEVEASGGRWKGREMFVGDVIWGAVESGLHVETVLFEDGGYVDIGTPEDLAAAVRWYSGPTAGAAGGTPP